jgi:hypothetical protein
MPTRNHDRFHCKLYAFSRIILLTYIIQREMPVFGIIHDEVVVGIMVNQTSLVHCELSDAIHVG